MAAPTRREVRINAKTGLKSQYRAYKALHPEIEETLKIFNEYKREIPPRRLPAHMKDHVLESPLDGIRECHLADDVLLLYTHRRDVVEMLYICQHEDLYGRRQRQLAAHIRKLL